MRGLSSGSNTPTPFSPLVFGLPGVPQTAIQAKGATTAALLPPRTLCPPQLSLAAALILLFPLTCRCHTPLCQHPLTATHTLAIGTVSHGTSGLGWSAQLPFMADIILSDKAHVYFHFTAEEIQAGRPKRNDPGPTAAPSVGECSRLTTDTASKASHQEWATPTQRARPLLGAAESQWRGFHWQLPPGPG